MIEYRAFIVGPDGHFAASRGFVCENDEHAVEWAKQALADQPIELWSGERLVTRLMPQEAKRHGSTSHEIHEGRMIRTGKP